MAHVATERLAPPDDSPAMRVRRGAYLLDEFNPRWARKVDPASLDLRMSCLCVLGQVYGHYHGGLRHLHMADPSGPRPSFYGFHARDDGEWQTLTDLWRTEIARRMEHRAAVLP